MLNDLRKHDCLGTPNYFFELLNTIKKSSSTEWRLADLNQLFHNRTIDNRPIIDGGIDLALKTNILQENSSVYTINPDFENHLTRIIHIRWTIINK